jgi:hypothetical protein
VSCRAASMQEGESPPYSRQPFHQQQPVQDTCHHVTSSSQMEANLWQGVLYSPGKQLLLLCVRLWWGSP